MKITDSVERIDSRAKIRGMAKYIEDKVYPEMLYAKTLRSDHARARINQIKYPECPQGIYVIDSKDVILNNEVSMIDTAMPVFSNETIYYAGEPIALIVGSDKDAVLRYMEGIEIDYILEEDPFFDLDTASKVPSNILTAHTIEKGNLNTIEYDFVLEETFRTPYQEQLYMEKQGMIGRFEEGVIIVEGSMQCPYYILNALKHMTGWNEDRLRVIQATTGGAFGGKEEYPSLLACQVATAAYKLKKPVQLILDRREDIAFSTKRHPARIYVKSYVKNQKIQGMEMEILLDAGGYLGLSDVVLQRALLTMTGAYKVDHLRIEGKTVRTNNVFTGAFRGFGAPQSLYALELHMTHLANRLNLDPMTFRENHFVVEGDPTSTEGIFHEHIPLHELSDKCRKLAEANMASEKKQKWVGYGVAVVPHGGGFTGDGEAAHIKAVVHLRKEADGMVTILVSNVEMGQGAITALSKIVASALEIPISRVKYEIPDTSKVPDSGPTVASRTTMVVGALLYRAALDLKPHLQELGTYTAVESYKKPDYVVWDQETFKGNAYLAYSWVALIARVEVNPLTYEVKCTHIWSCYDVGRPIDEQMSEGQAHGGMIQGLGYALMEHMTSKGGFIEQFAFSSYPIPTPMDIPEMTVEWVINPYEDGPFGAKAVGELTLVGVAPAISAAIEDAIGHETFTIPVTPEIIERTLSVWKNSN
ncbi:xanthine dehydrogenase family protein molybdopterin-binding subunit [Fusibacter tunisiensis]|uniref:CO/xanthine dehydrogenase Mo-binding subunit n=1 Tax=Fusibacter tunisiensis TaxID=1008308 RepID=A0ABS2MQQ8_9FIRM|nr:xanthine dehydrogenase family protein molybdopterin-binding subunit [Fusibacter tunisiensis]MBM7561734.1 CO/xanthine dehydrogenase Mo-binding subunit [Fusibacter tunisiensis]